jgi:hypothetical protein
LTTAFVTITLNGPAQTPVTVNWSTMAGTATAGSDYLSASGSFTFALGGVMSVQIPVSIVGDTVNEPNETFTVQAAISGGASNTSASGTVTIVNDDPLISINSVSANEGNSGTTLVTLTVTLSMAATIPVSVGWATADGTGSAGATAASGDYVAASGTVNFAVGQTSKTFTVTINGDTLYEPNETFSVVLSSPVGGSIGTGTGTVTIVNDDAKPTVALAGTSLSGAEQNKVPIVFTLTRGANLTGPLTVSLGWTGTATFGTDYTVAVNNGALLSADGSTLTMPAGVSTVTVTATPVDDSIIENTETVILTVGTSSGYTVSGTASQTGTITDNDKATVNVSNLSQLEGNGGTSSPTNFVVTVSLSAPAPYAITVTLATAATPTPLPAGTAAATGGSTLTSSVDYKTATFTVTFAAGQTTATVTVLVNGDKTVEPNEVFNVNITNAGAAVAGTNGTVTILNDDGPLNATAVGTAADAATTAPSDTVLAAALAAAKQRWIGAGVSAARLAPVTVQIADLPGTLVGLTTGTVITLDRDAAGWGWFTDTSSASANLFVSGVAKAGTAAAGRIDLLTVLVHELGHVLGFEHTAHGVMEPTLAPGVRRLAISRPAPVRHHVVVRAVKHRTLHRSSRGGRR